MGPEELNAQLARANKASQSTLAAVRRKQAETAAAEAGPTARALSADEEQFIKDLLPNLPPIIARSKVPHYLGGLVGSGSLANADSAGRGPERAYRIGHRMVAYETESLLRWIVSHFSVSRLKNINRL